MSAGPSAALTTRWLSCHVDYACRHSGHCCRSGWPLPVESHTVPAIDAAVATGRIRTVDGTSRWLVEPAGAPAGMAGRFRLVDDACVFHVPVVPVHTRLAGEGVGQRHCAVHTGLGHAALPAACQHFPRVCVIDSHGVRVSLSHYCPTAASMCIEHDRPVAIVDGPPAVPGRALPEGLDVREDLPPRLSDAVLADGDGFAAWEAHVVATLAGPQAASSAEEALGRVIADARVLAGWRPGSATLSAAVSALDATDATSRDGQEVAGVLRNDDRVAGLRIAIEACRAPWIWEEAPRDLAALDARYVQPAWEGHAGVVRRYLAAKAFGSWLAYQADATLGLASWLRLCLSVLRIEAARACGASDRPLDRESLHAALREADRLLVHHADGLAIARTLGQRPAWGLAGV